jgi:hypothetical protein
MKLAKGVVLFFFVFTVLHGVVPESVSRQSALMDLWSVVQHLCITLIADAIHFFR